MYPLMLTVEHEDLLEREGTGLTTNHYAIIKLNGLELKRIEMTYFHKTDERELLEQAVADWLTRNLIRP